MTELPQLRSPALPGWADLVIGGHDIVATPVLKKAEALAAAGVLPARLVAALTDELTAHEDDLRPLARRGDPGGDRRRPSPPISPTFRDRHELDTRGRGQRVHHRTGRPSRIPRTPTWTRSPRR